MAAPEPDFERPADAAGIAAAIGFLEPKGSFEPSFRSFDELETLQERMFAESRLV
jgi:hypothetical protein